LHVALGACAILVLAALHRDPESPFYKARWQPAWLVVVGIAVLLNFGLLVSIRDQVAEARVMVRNFYGVLREIDIEGPQVSASQAGTENPADAQLARRQLLNGTIEHGLEFLAPDRHDLPTAYYGPHSGAGLALSVAAERGPLRVGVIGLGVGTLATYGRPGDHYTFYEINPQVIELAQRDFYFLRDSAAQIKIVPGDARLSLEREAPQHFDVLAVDAFSGDAIPVHLLTREAFELYFHHLKPGGVLAVHISNSYLDLRPVVAQAAAWLHKPAVLIVNEDDQANGVYRSSWVLMAGNSDFFAAPQIKTATRPLPSATQVRMWTDDYSNLFAILKWRMR
jgi:SAM-dependent methyltransferase